MRIAAWKLHVHNRVICLALLAGFVLLQPGMAPAQSQPAQIAPGTQIAQVNKKVFPRVTEQLKGVFSPRSFFNILVRVDKLPGVVRAKFDLKKSQLTLDFLPGTVVSPEQIRRVMVDAGYTPGPFKIENVPVTAPPDNRPGWVKIKHPKSRSALVRWLEINF